MRRRWGVVVVMLMLVVDPTAVAGLRGGGLSPSRDPLGFLAAKIAGDETTPIVKDDDPIWRYAMAEMDYPNGTNQTLDRKNEDARTWTAGGNLEVLDIRKAQPVMFGAAARGEPYIADPAAAFFLPLLYAMSWNSLMTYCFMFINGFDSNMKQSLPFTLTINLTYAVFVFHFGKSRTCLDTARKLINFYHPFVIMMLSSHAAKGMRAEETGDIKAMKEEAEGATGGDDGNETKKESVIPLGNDFEESHIRPLSYSPAAVRSADVYHVARRAMYDSAQRPASSPSSSTVDIIASVSTGRASDAMGRNNHNNINNNNNNNNNNNKPRHSTTPYISATTTTTKPTKTTTRGTTSASKPSTLDRPAQLITTAPNTATTPLPAWAVDRARRVHAMDRLDLADLEQLSPIQANPGSEAGWGTFEPSTTHADKVKILRVDGLSEQTGGGQQTDGGTQPDAGSVAKGADNAGEKETGKEKNDTPDSGDVGNVAGWGTFGPSTTYADKSKLLRADGLSGDEPDRTLERRERATQEKKKSESKRTTRDGAQPEDAGQGETGQSADAADSFAATLAQGAVGGDGDDVASTEQPAEAAMDTTDTADEDDKAADMGIATATAATTTAAATATTAAATDEATDEATDKATDTGEKEIETEGDATPDNVAPTDANTATEYIKSGEDTLNPADSASDQASSKSATTWTAANGECEQATAEQLEICRTGLLYTKYRGDLCYHSAASDTEGPASSSSSSSFVSLNGLHVPCVFSDADCTATSGCGKDSAKCSLDLIHLKDPPAANKTFTGHLLELGDWAPSIIDILAGPCSTADSSHTRKTLKVRMLSKDKRKLTKTKPFDAVHAERKKWRMSETKKSNARYDLYRRLTGDFDNDTNTTLDDKASTGQSPEAVIDAHLRALAPYVAVVKVDTPDVWEAAYKAATAPTDVATAQDLTGVGDLATLGPDALAGEMTRVKFLWSALGMYSKDEFTDPNPRVKAEMARYKAGKEPMIDTNPYGSGEEKIVTTPDDDPDPEADVTALPDKQKSNAELMSVEGDAAVQLPAEMGTVTTDEIKEMATFGKVKAKRRVKYVRKQYHVPFKTKRVFFVIVYTIGYIILSFVLTTVPCFVLPDI